MAVASDLTRYRPLRKIASGGMATISLAEDTVLGRPVALKRVRGTASRSGISRLRREALVGASVSHPNLVSIYDVVTEDEDVVIVMEYVDGRTLKDAVAQQGRLAPGETLRILRGVADALDAIHARGIVHRDVKPPNILLGRGGEVKLADLGIAAAPDHTRITTEGSVLGSFSYMAPEQLEAAPASPAMDVYALAAVAFEALSGRRAHREENPLALAHAIATQPPPDLKAAWPEAPAAVVELLKRGMSRDPQNRPPSAGALVRGLQSALGPGPGAQGSPVGLRQSPSPSRPERPRPPSRRPGSRQLDAAAAGVGAAALLGGASASAAPAHAAAPAPPAAPGAADAPGAVPVRPRGDDPEPGLGRRVGWLAPLLLGLVALAVLAAVLSSGGGSHPTAAKQSARTRVGHKARARARSTPAAVQSTTGTGSTAATPATSAAPAGSGGNSTPVSAVERFYELAASHQYSAAWALADPAFRAQLGGYDSFVAGQEGDIRIIFNSARVVNQSAGAATVAIGTTSIRTDGTTQCGGTVDVVSGQGGWLLHQISINCQPVAGSGSQSGAASGTGPADGPGKTKGKGKGPGKHS